MKFRCFYNNTIKNPLKVDEIVFLHGTQKLSELAAFKQQYPAVKVWVMYKTEEITKVDDIFDEAADLKAGLAGIMLESWEYITKELIENIHKLGFEVSCYTPVSSFEGIKYALDCAIDDFGITAPVAFEMDYVNRLIKEEREGQHVWICPDIAQTQYKWEHTNKSFYVLPQDLEQYEYFGIDTAFIMQNSEKTNVIVDIYKQGNWEPILAPLILNYTEEDAEGILIPPHFGNRRTTCRQACMKGTSHCSTCELLLARPNIMSEEEKTIEK